MVIYKNQLSVFVASFRKRVKTIQTPRLLRKMQAFCPTSLFIDSLKSHVNFVQRDAQTITHQLWKIWQTAEFFPQLCLKERNCPVGTSVVLLLLVLYCQHITFLTVYTNIWFVFNEMRDLFLQHILYFASNTTVLYCL